jgi:carbon starvation protein
MTTLWIVVIGVITIGLAYNVSAKRIDCNVIQSDAKRAAPAKTYMDGVDFMPTSRNVLFGASSTVACAPVVGLFETEVRGLPMLQRLCDAIFAANGANPAHAQDPGARREAGLSV